MVSNTNSDSTSSIENIGSYWDTFYTRQRRRLPSQFAAMVASELHEPHFIIDLGCGNGRDTVFLAECGHRCIGLDASETIIEANKSEIDQLVDRGLSFKHFLIGENRLSEIWNTDISEQSKDLPVIIYSRFLLHAIPETLENFLVHDIYQCGSNLSNLYIEYRELRDKEIDKIYSDHYRRFVDAGVFARKMMDNGGMILDYQIIGRGLAKFREEDPWIARQIFVAGRDGT